MRSTLLSIALLLTVAAACLGADLAGAVFVDTDRDGVRDPGEPGVAATVDIVGTADAGGPVDVAASTAADGSFSLSGPAIGEGAYLVGVTLPAGYRLEPATLDCPGSNLGHPVGTRRYSSARGLVYALRSGSLFHIALGDSIAEPASACVGAMPFDDTDYVLWLQERLSWLGSGTGTDNNAIGGKRSYDLLYPAGTCGPPNLPRPGDTRCDNIFDTITRAPDLVTISIGGNDWLGSEPNKLDEPFDPAEVQASVDTLLRLRMNMQEILSTLVTELPAADIVVNTVYNPAAFACGSPAFYNVWFPIWNRMLRDVAEGQGDRVHVAEVGPEFAYQDLNGGDCCGEQDLICFPGLDGIHPNARGAKVILEKVWEGVGGVSLGPKDALGVSSNGDLSFPVAELLAVRYPTAYADGTPGAGSPDDALARDDAGALVPSGNGAFTVSGFDAAPDGIVPTLVVVAVRYMTDAPPEAGADGDLYFFEASPDGSFAPPTYTVTGWNTVVPIVGAGSNAPVRNAVSHAPAWREVRAKLTRNLLDDGRAAGQYDFPAIDWSDIARLAVRLRGETRGAAADARRVEWDAAWVEVYGTRQPAAGCGVYRSEQAQGLVSSGNLIAPAATSPFDDTPPAVPELYYAVDDGAGTPAVIHLTKQPAATVRLSW